MITLCTYCDSGYAARLRVMLDSVRRHSPNVRIRVFCFDRAVESAARHGGDALVDVVPLADIERRHPDFAATKASRSRIEYFFTATPVVIADTLAASPEGAWTVYVDADLHFRAPVESVVALHESASVAIIPHNYSKPSPRMLVWGTYNVGWVAFRADDIGRACCQWWRARCLEWCRDEPDGNGRFADQGYLDHFPVLFKNVSIVQHRGVNVAPWNLDGAALGGTPETPRIDGVPILFVHFQGVRELRPGTYDTGLRTYQTLLSRNARELLYQPYLAELDRASSLLEHEYGIKRQLGYQRLPCGRSLRDLWTRIKIAVLMPWARRFRQEVINVRRQHWLPFSPS